MKNLMKSLSLSFATVLVFLTPQGALTAENSFTLVATCMEVTDYPDDAVKVEVWVPDQFCCGGADGLLNELTPNTVGRYALDLTSIGKGKPLEPVHLQASQQPQGLWLTQHTRPGIPSSFLPVNGGIVKFDERFASNMNCTPLFGTSKLE